MTEAMRLITAHRIEHDLMEIGVHRKMTLMVHSSLSAMGWVLGGPAIVVRTLTELIGVDGTLIMPAATPQCAHPASWNDPNVKRQWWDEIEDQLPIFDMETTPTTLGAIPEAFRTWPATCRSHHPLESICARGSLAREITKTHALAFSEGSGGPFQKLFDENCWILLLGVGFNRCTALHYAESLQPKRRTTKVRFPWYENGQRIWHEVPNVADDNDTHFPRIGQRFVTEKKPRQGLIGQAPSYLFPMRELVEVASHYFSETI